MLVTTSSSTKYANTQKTRLLKACFVISGPCVDGPQVARRPFKHQNQLKVQLNIVRPRVLNDCTEA